VNAVVNIIVILRVLRQSIYNKIIMYVVKGTTENAQRWRWHWSV